jgi:hypothetical protein
MPKYGVGLGTKMGTRSRAQAEDQIVAVMSEKDPFYPLLETIS